MKGIDVQTTARKTPSQDGGPERKIETLVNITRSLIHRATFPFSRWGFAFDHAVYLTNILPVTSKAISSPFQAITGLLPRINHLRIFGCAAFYHLEKSDRNSKLDTRTLPAIYVGCVSPSLVKLIDLASGKAIVRRFKDCVFNESTFPKLAPTSLQSFPGLHVTNVDNKLSTNVDVKVRQAILKRRQILDDVLSPAAISALRNKRSQPRPHSSVQKLMDRQMKDTHTKV
jgi:hypothetical protein